METSDLIIGDAPIPQESSQNNCWGEIHIVGRESDAKPTDEAMLWGSEGWVIQVPDPDTPLDLNTLWDRFVPKDAEMNAGTFDLDTTASVPAGFFDIGEVNMNALVGMSALPLDNKWWSSRRLISFANSPRGYVAGTPDVYIPTDIVNVRSGKKIRAAVPSYSLIAAGMPSMGDVDTSRNTPADEIQWMYLQYAEMALEQAFIQIMGNIEVGAETPWDIAALALQEFVEPEYQEPATTSQIDNTDCHCFSQMTFDITVPGKKEFSQISGDR